MNISDYHRRSKHAPARYAPGPGTMDWANQPDPFRTFAGATSLELPLIDGELPARYGDLRAGRLPVAAPFDRTGVAALLELSLGISAWKQAGASRWALRCNPSSGNLHPTEGYLVAPELPGLPRGVWHYVSRDHRLERRAAPSDEAWDRAFGGGLLVGLASIHWREAWKYGMRAFRYCQHDTGHALAAVCYAAAALGWRARALHEPGDRAIAALLGIDRTQDFEEAESELPETLLWLGTGPAPDVAALAAMAGQAKWYGRANRLSAQHRDWPDIDIAHRLGAKPASDGDAAAAATRPLPLPQRLDLPASRLVRQRRSAVAFDGETEMQSASFFALLDALLPRPDAPPWFAWPFEPRAHLALFVHRVSGVEPGLYLLVRRSEDLPVLRAAMRGDWLWHRTGPAELPLYLLLPHDLRAVAGFISCHQDIAADGCFALGMLANMDQVDREPWRYRRLFWECGVIGQAAYLEAEAAGFRGTGIGCFFDDEMHRLLGLRDERWQSLYHFTVGAALNDPRLITLPAYSTRGSEPRPGTGSGRGRGAAPG